MAETKTALITGIAGGMAQLVALELQRRGYTIVGVDYRRFDDEALGLEAQLYQANYNKTRIEDIFRRHHPTHVLHLGRVGNLKERMGKRFDLNVIGSRKVMDLALKYGARRMVVLSTFHIYGAHPHNHIPIFEDEPLRAGVDFPQMLDAVQLDTQALLWTYQHRELPTALLRPTNVVGPHLKNAMSSFLRLPRVPALIGFDPMMQLIHEDDLTSAVVAATEGEAIGVFNVAGAAPLPWREVLRLTGAQRIPLPASFATLYLKTAGLLAATFPPYLVNFFKYPCIIGDEAFRRTFRWQHAFDEVECIRSTVGRR